MENESQTGYIVYAMMEAPWGTLIEWSIPIGASFFLQRKKAVSY